MTTPPPGWITEQAVDRRCSGLGVTRLRQERVEAPAEARTCADPQPVAGTDVPATNSQAVQSSRDVARLEEDAAVGLGEPNRM